ncbi:MAG TPA: hypothetical protein VHX90_02210 [Verrucomicrobiae bacterium]|jgi:hypothetical protein|nr:hypothetical protein [Verrucomicrobiae bacterium]
MSRWQSCNILQAAPDANRLWQFDAKSGVLHREHSGAPGQPLPGKYVAKSWTSLWQPKLNVAWLPLEKVFLRVIELPKSNFEETLSMVELQLEKLSPIPVTQIVWTLQILAQASAENLQTVIVVVAERKAVEEFLGKLEAQHYLADRLEAPMLDQLEATPASEDGAWIYPASLNGQNAALVAWWFGGALRSLSFIALPPDGDRAKNLQGQFAQLTWAGELEGWLVAQPKFHLVADGAAAGEWETFLREALNEPVQVTKPLSLQELAAHTARRATTAQSSSAALLPAEFSTRYHQQFVDRLWLRGLFATGILYAIAVVIYFCATFLLGVQTGKVEQQAAAISNDYTNALQLKARYDVLQQRQALKFAALDCWKVVAEQLPQGVALQRFSFANGQTLSLSGTTTSDQINTLFNFNSTMQKATLNGQPMFDLHAGESVSPHNDGRGNVSWNFSLQLLHTEDETP